MSLERFFAWHAGPRVVRELIWFSFIGLFFLLCVPLLLVPAFSLSSDLFPCSHGHIRNFVLILRSLHFLPFVGSSHELQLVSKCDRSDDLLSTLPFFFDIP